MEIPFDFSVANEFIENLFMYSSDWNDIYHLSLVNKQYRQVALRQRFEILFTITSDVKFDEYLLPINTARNIRVNCLPEATEYEINKISTRFLNCHCITVDFRAFTNWSLAKKMMKTILKKGLTLKVLNNMKPTKAESYIAKKFIKCQKQHDAYQTNQDQPCLKRKHSEEEFIALKVPRNHDLQRDFLLNHILTLTSSSSGTPSNSATNTTFMRISQVSFYKEAQGHSLFFTSGIEETMPLLEQYTNCVVAFRTFSLLVTSFDVFYHNHRYYDDCAQPLEKIYQIPTARVTRKTHTNKSFTEISIFTGHYELLAVAGYIHLYGSMSPFLGSSMARFSLLEEESTAITVPISFSPSIRSSRLLNQFMKRKSHEQWGIHSTLTYLQGFYPICPITLADHNSQKHKRENDSQFISQALQLFTQPSVIKQKDMDNLWTFMQRLKSYSKMVKAAKSPLNSFTDLSEYCKEIQEKSTFSSVIHHLSTVQKNVPCFFLSLHTYVEAKQIALSIKNSLNEHINKQHRTIIDSAKSRL